MKLALRQHTLAKNDIEQQVEYYASESGLSLAERFVHSVQESFEFLLEFPSTGSLLQTRIGRLQDIRCWPVKNFPKHVIYYRVQGDTLLVLRVLHGSRLTIALLSVLP